MRSLPGQDPADVRAADDAADIGWFSREEISALRTSPGLLPTLVSWGVLAQG
ncbi:hypothetical protein [Nocardioides mesophilus]|uniref:hypothetical protein n=1 Tax=Nocardioides mesophilus TaxID=433659 RepID=UPI001CB6BE80|nr:hypothetical protein [Nocardioides mesophilus]